MRITPPQPGFTRTRRQKSPAISDSLPPASDFYVSSLPGYFPAQESTPLSFYAGHLPSGIRSTPPKPTDSDAALYFLLAGTRHIPKRERLMIWLNGGPGCSSFQGAMMEIGPLRVTPEANKLRIVESTAWNEYANVLFLDQPAGTGYSYVTKNDDVRELAQAADQVVMFLSNFYKVFPEYEKMDMYISGESYAGQYIPYIADAILKTTLVKPHLKGILIGNGWISPKHQYPAYHQYLLDKQLIRRGSAGDKRMEKAVTECIKQIEALEESNGGRGTVLINDCEAIVPIIEDITKNSKGECMSIYNSTQFIPCGKSWPEDLAYLTPYLRSEDVRAALHADPGPVWEHCSQKVGSHFWTPNSLPSSTLLPSLLEKMSVLLFNGDNDIMCAGVGIENMISELEWAGEVGFGGVTAKEWIVDSKNVGTWRTARGLTYVNFYNASHMVPMDQPVAAHDMILRFMEVDTLHAAGRAARVPSRIGSETPAVLGATLPDGSTIKKTNSTLNDSKLSEELKLKNHDMTYGPRQTVALIVLLLAIGVIVWSFFKWRERKRVERFRRIKGKGRAQTTRLEEGRKGSPYTKGYNNLANQRLLSDPIPTEQMASSESFDVGADDESEPSGSNRNSLHRV